MQNESVIKHLETLLPKEGILLNEPMANHTTFRIGGPCDLMVLPRSEEEVVKVISFFEKEGLPYLIMGNGSNLLIRDGGIRGTVIKLLGNYSEIRPDRAGLYAQAGALMSGIGKFCIQAGLGGMEFASGIPGTIGGGVFMNAGAYEHELKDIVKSVRALTREQEVVELSNEEMQFAHRESLAHKQHMVVLGATLALEEEIPGEVQARIDDYTRRRTAKQPLMYPSAGSVFKRPQNGFAAKMIDDAGLKGARVGDAQVSEMHAGFIVNRGHATAKEVLDLISMIQQRVLDRFGTQLCTEIRILGEDE